MYIYPQMSALYLDLMAKVYDCCFPQVVEVCLHVSAHVEVMELENNKSLVSGAHTHMDRQASYKL